MNETRSNSKQRILDAAFEHFVQQGYEGASLSAIAETVGIRKASIYTHFKSKEAIFLQLLQDTVQIETAYMRSCFSMHPQEKLPGEYYLTQFKARYDQAITARFLIRMAYVPPHELMSEVAHCYERYIEALRQCYHQQITVFGLAPTLCEIFTDAYLGILDSLSVELLYAGQIYARRLDAMLWLYQNSVNAYLKQSS